jgi:hypothetical protein
LISQSYPPLGQPISYGKGIIKFPEFLSLVASAVLAIAHNQRELAMFLPAPARQNSFWEFFSGLLDRSVYPGIINAVKMAGGGGSPGSGKCEGTFEKETLMSRFITSLLLGAVALCATSAYAGPLNGDANAFTDMNGTWTGTTSYQGYNDYPINNDPSDMHGTIDWVVYGPGVYATLGYDPGYVAAPGAYVYAYQVIQDGDAGAPLSSLSVVLEAVANNIGTFTGNGVVGVPTTGQFFIGLPFPSATWDFAADTVQGGETSVGLAFSSPFGPKLLSGSVIDDGSVGDVIPLPSPDPQYIPEPGTMTLALCGLVVFGFQLLRRRRKQNS